MPDILFDIIEDGMTVDVVTTDPVIDVGIDETIISVVTVEGPPGLPGPPGEGTPVVGELLAGVRNGSNPVFTTADPYRPNTTAVCRNGLREVRGVGYTETGAGTTITFDEPPLSDDEITVDYIIQ